MIEGTLKSVDSKMAEGIFTSRAWNKQCEVTVMEFQKVSS